MKIIGITGISGSGKTVAAAILAKMGAFVVEADSLAHSLMEKGCEAYDEIVSAFGVEILDGSGEIHRPSLGKLVFEDGDRLRLLEGIIHPRVIEKTNELIANATESGIYSFAVIDAPLLIEAGMHKMCDSTWLITASHETRLARIMARDNLTKEAAEKRLASRKGDEFLQPHVDIVIENDDENIEKLQKKLNNSLKRLKID
ncbi:MAG: dephospho-CoA kinase [Defluviitaleaceae bacterium]|nr:dephospho-CoA kinase [Defluviitaleaceae bacterium]